MLNLPSLLTAHHPAGAAAGRLLANACPAPAHSPRLLTFFHPAGAGAGHQDGLGVRHALTNTFTISQPLTTCPVESGYLSRSAGAGAGWQIGTALHERRRGTAVAAAAARRDRSCSRNIGSHINFLPSTCPLPQPAPPFDRSPSRRCWCREGRRRGGPCTLSKPSCRCCCGSQRPAPPVRGRSALSACMRCTCCSTPRAVPPLVWSRRTLGC